jgi:16S rRNA (cytosine1402-N4)-methyltransferase
MSDYHVPVMLQECIDNLVLNPDGVYVDVTYGGGGHSRAILNKLSDKGTLLAFDQDLDAVKNKTDDKRLVFCNSNFRYLQNFCSFYKINEIDGVLADLGVSSHHFNEGSRGFSFRFKEADLDMRMNKDADISAIDVLNTYEYEPLFRLLKDYGELPKATHMANAIISFRRHTKITKPEHLEQALDSFISDKTRNKQLAKVYQAIRIEVNQEMAALEEMLTQATSLLKPTGRLVVMSYHSLEDRMVKNLIQTGNTAGERITDAFGNLNNSLKAVNRKPIIPTETEIDANPRARSAKLRVAEKL